MDRVIIFDTTLRDGEQSPGFSMNAQEKLEMARQLARLNVDVIEAGFPISSDEDFEAVREVARHVGTLPGSPIICGLSRAGLRDIDRAGQAVANSLVAVQNGARQIECTINGIGERAGNAALEEIVMALRTRKDYFGIETQVRTEEIYRTSKLLSHITGVHVQPNKAIVGENAFAHEAGIHQDGVLKEKLTYEIMRPEDIGRAANKLVMGKHSGRRALAARLGELGFELDGSDLDRAFKKFKDLA